jgi:signal peptidase I
MDWVGTADLRRPAAGQQSEQHLVKRIIGLPGDRVSCCDAGGPPFVNGVPVDETYINPAEVPQCADFDVVVPQGKVWVMGDNRNHSEDSRAHTDSQRRFRGHRRC